jgi:DMSO/TMAO reductase YedYZ molybdopterin-dependent catalytic subunit
LAGLLSAGLILGVAELVSVPIAADSAPVDAFGSLVIDHTPAGVREWAIQTVGTNDKHLLFAIIGVGAVVIACLAGLVERRRRPIGSLLFVAFGVVGVIAANSRADTNWTHALPTVLGVVAGVMALRRLTDYIDELPARRAEPAAEPVDPALRLANRRAVLRGLGAVAALAAVTATAGRLLGAKARNVAANRASVVLPAPQGPPPPVTGEIQVSGISPYITANSRFYRIDTALDLPEISTHDWSLRIHGMVDREITLRYDDLAKRPAIERLVTLTCVSNPVGGPLIGNAKWLGYRLADLLAEAQPHPDADMLLSTSIDGFSAGSPLATLTDGRDAMLAVGMNGQPLPIEHGYPVRLVVPGLYGYVSATKWVTDLEVTRFDKAQGYWTPRGWSAKGPIKTGTRIDTPGDSASPRAGRVPVAGVAWAQHRGIGAVEVQVDNGPWTKAELTEEPSIDTWRQWVYYWDATPGKHTLTARATDNSGAVQTSDEAPPAPDGATGFPSVTVTVTG